MNIKDITVGIVAFRSEKVIFRCLKSLENIKKIIILDNSNDLILKEKIKKVYPHINFILSKKNNGYGSGNNKIFRLAKTSHVLVLNPDTILSKNCIKELIHQANLKKNKFAILAPSEKNIIKKEIIEVDHVKGFSMLVNLSKIKKIKMFDENYFLYLEEIDLCKRLRLKSEKIYICGKAKIIHLSAKSSNIGFEFEKCRNWQWMWSKVYYDKKFYGMIYAIKKSFFHLLKNLSKSIFFLLILNYDKFMISYLRFSGTYNSLIGKKSWYRPKIN
ncbi:glycosyltransferase family 2 protein [Candidatus Pelagibacter sp.]|nr:glycosyltransferase family 2 protein [Candidatus Pelagibacter sp.]